MSSLIKRVLLKRYLLRRVRAFRYSHSLDWITYEVAEHFKKPRKKGVKSPDRHPAKGTTIKP